MIGIMQTFIGHSDFVFGDLHFSEEDITLLTSFELRFDSED